MGKSNLFLISLPVFIFLDVFPKALLAFLTSKGLYYYSESVGTRQARVVNTMSNVCSKWWPSCSWWHSAQSNHLRPSQGIRNLLKSVGKFPKWVLTAWGPYRNLSVEDVLAADDLRLGPSDIECCMSSTDHMMIFSDFALSTKRCNSKALQSIIKR